MQAFSKTLLRCFAPIEAEALPLRETLKWITQLQLENVNMEMDYKLVVDVLHCIRIDLKNLCSLIKEYKDMVLSREQNFSENGRFFGEKSEIGRAGKENAVEKSSGN